MEAPFAILLVAFLLLGLRLLAGLLDGERIAGYAAERGWKLRSRRWEPFGPGWFGDGHDRIYRICYEDERGALHTAHAKTSLMSGVYLTNDQVLHGSASAADTATGGHDLEEENRRLRERLARYEQGT